MSRILVVDDDADFRDSLEDFLETHEVVTAQDGTDALDVLSQGALPDVALIDFCMPKMDGLELIKRMRSDPRLASIPIIMISAGPAIRHPLGTTALSKVGMRKWLLQEIERLSA